MSAHLMNGWPAKASPRHRGRAHEPSAPHLQQQRDVESESRGFANDGDARAHSEGDCGSLLGDPRIGKKRFFAGKAEVAWRLLVLVGCSLLGRRSSGVVHSLRGYASSLAEAHRGSNGRKRTQTVRSRNVEQREPESYALPSSFGIRANQTFATFNGEPVLETFHSFVPLPLNQGYQVVYKRTTKDETLGSGRAQSIETMQLSPAFERLEATRRELGDESWDEGNSGLSDPRGFWWNNSAYALAWRHQGKDHETFLFNLMTGEKSLLGHCIRGYRGKNWVPLVYREQLYVIHRLSPELAWFKYDAYDGCPEPPARQEYGKDDIDEWRGGSAFVPCGSSSMISLGHRTIDGNRHVPFLLQVDMADNKIRKRARKIRLAAEQRRFWTGILDPTSLWWGDDGKLWMGTTRTTGSWKKCYFKDRPECVFNNSIYEVELQYDALQQERSE